MGLAWVGFPWGVCYSSQRRNSLLASVFLLFLARSTVARGTRIGTMSLPGLVVAVRSSTGAGASGKETATQSTVSDENCQQEGGG
ncbi:unnamed protein product [Closterium sp. NIES-54]